MKQLSFLYAQAFANQKNLKKKKTSITLKTGAHLRENFLAVN